jgi:hypothetical protein
MSVKREKRNGAGNKAFLNQENIELKIDASHHSNRYET